MNKKKDWRSGKDKPTNQGTARQEIKLDYHTISTRFLEMQESNSRLQKLITKFTTDGDRQMRSVFESVQYQNSIAREARKTSANFKPQRPPARTVPAHGVTNGPRDSYNRMPLMSRNFYQSNGTTNYARQVEDSPQVLGNERETGEPRTQYQNGIYLNQDMEVILSHFPNKPRHHGDISESGKGRGTEEVPRSFVSNYGIRYQRLGNF